MIKYAVKGGMKLLIHSQTSTVQPIEFGNEQFHPTHYNGCNYLSMLWLNLIHLSKIGLRSQCVRHYDCDDTNTQIYNKANLRDVMRTAFPRHDIIMRELLLYSDVMMSAKASQITGASVVCSNVCSGADQRKHQISASLAFVRGTTGDQWIPLTKGQ